MRLEGFEELKRKLDTLPRVAARRIMRKALNMAARQILSVMQTKAPLMTHAPFKLKSGGLRRTGEIRAALQIRPMERSRTKFGVNIGVWKGHEAYAGDTWWMAAVEFGHRIGKRPDTVAALSKRLNFVSGSGESYAEYLARRKARLGDIDHRRDVPPRSFIRAGYDESIGGARNVIREIVRAELDKEAARQT